MQLEKIESLGRGACFSAQSRCKEMCVRAHLLTLCEDKEREGEGRGKACRTWVKNLGWKK